MRRERKSNIALGLFVGVIAIVVLSVLIVGAIRTLTQVFEANPRQIVTHEEESGQKNQATITTYQSSSAVKTTMETPFCVVIDPGHGGEESPGAVFDGAKESHINLKIALRLKEKLEEIGVRVILTRQTDAEMALMDRVIMANEANADLFISIHQNSLASDTVTNGLETWYYGEKEDGSRQLAELVQECCVGQTGAKNRGLRQTTELVVVRETTMASCLVEVGFLSCEQERVRLVSEEYQEQIACGLAEAVIRYRAIL